MNKKSQHNHLSQSTYYSFGHEIESNNILWIVDNNFLYKEINVKDWYKNNIQDKGKWYLNNEELGRELDYLSHGEVFNDDELYRIKGYGRIDLDDSNGTIAFEPNISNNDKQQVIDIVIQEHPEIKWRCYGIGEGEEGIGSSEAYRILSGHFGSRKNWLQRVSGLEELLSPINKYPGIGEEKDISKDGDISIYQDEYGSNRYVLKKDGLIVCGMQVMVKDDIAILSNIYTHPNYRRLGYAKKLYNRIKSDYPNLQVSSDLSELGEKFIGSFK